MRSLIIIEVEHGEDTDGINVLMEGGSAYDLFSDEGVRITDYTVRVDLPECFVL